MNTTYNRPKYKFSIECCYRDTIRSSNKLFESSWTCPLKYDDLNI